jgi:cell division ATPase FtsA
MNTQNISSERSITDYPIADQDAVPLQLKSTNEFSMFIEKAARAQNTSYLETILQFCDDHMIDPEDIAGKVNKSLKEKLEHEFRELNYLPKKAQLDVS